MNFILSAIAGALSALTIFFVGPTSVHQPLVGAALPSATAVFETSLASPISSSATSMTLTANSVRGGGSVSGYNCFTIDEGSAQAETVCGTVSSTAVTSMSRGISQSTGTTSVVALQFSHRRGANVKITDFPLIQILKAQANGEDTYPNLLTYANTVLIGGSSPTTTIATKYYVDNTALSGAPDSDASTKGILEKATATEAGTQAADGSGNTTAPLALTTSIATSTCQTTGYAVLVASSTTGKLAGNCLDTTNNAYTWAKPQTFSSTVSVAATSTVATTTHNGVEFNGTNVNTFTAGEAMTGQTLPVPVEWATTTAKVWIADGNVASTTNFIGFAINSPGAGGSAYVQTDGIVGGFTGLTSGARYYVSDTAGTLSTTIGTYEVYVGIAVSTTQIFIDNGPTASWQYLGSCNSFPCTAPDLARFAVVSVSDTGTNSEAVNNDIVLSRKGKTSGTASNTGLNSGGGAVGTVSVTATWSGSAVSLSGTSPTGTVYWYR